MHSKTFKNIWGRNIIQGSKFKECRIAVAVKVAAARTLVLHSSTASLHEMGRRNQTATKGGSHYAPMLETKDRQYLRSGCLFRCHRIQGSETGSLSFEQKVLMLAPNEAQAPLFAPLTAWPQVTAETLHQCRFDDLTQNYLSQNIFDSWTSHIYYQE